MDDSLIHLLLIEDNPGDARLLREILADEGAANFKLTHADRLAEGFQCLADGAVDIVLLDLSLPDAQGLDTFLKTQAQAPELPIVVLSGLADETLAVKAVQSGAQDYLVKGHVDGNLLSRSLRYAIERKRAEQRIRHHLQRITALREINLAMTSTLDLDAALALLLENINALLHYPAAAVWLRSAQTGRLEAAAFRNIPAEEWNAERREGGGLAGDVWESRSPVVLKSIPADPRVTDAGFFARQGFASCAVVPLVATGEVVGALCFYGREERQFGEEEVEFLSTLAGQIAIAIHNSQLYQRIKTQAAALERANRMKSEFLSVMSHELRTPLNVVLGYTEMIQNRILGEINPEQQDALGRILRHSHQLLTMIDSILEATRIESSKVRVEYRATSMNAFLDDLRSAYSIPLEKDVTLAWDYPPIPTVIRTDTAKLSQILKNLIDNAIKFTPRGKVRVSARVVRPRRVRRDPEPSATPGTGAPDAGPFIASVPASPDESGDWVEFQVADTGIGIAEDSIPVIFQMFQQLDSSKTRPYGGTGLGLYIVKTFTELLGGELGVESELGKGSTFSVRLPLEPKRRARATLLPAGGA